MSVVSLPDDKSVKLVPHVHGVDPRDPRLRVDQRGPRLRVDTEGPASTGGHRGTRVYGVDTEGPASTGWTRGTRRGAYGRAQRQAPLHSPRFQPHTASYHLLLKIINRCAPLGTADTLRQVKGVGVKNQP